MTRLDRLTAEDEEDFERVLDRALNTPQIDAAMRRTETPVTVDGLRTQALRDQGTIMAAALQDYGRYHRLRASAAPRLRPIGKSGRGADHGLLGAVGFLAPVLAATAALVFLVFGYGLRFAGDRSSVARGLVDVGWGAAAIAALATLAGLTGLLVTAVRNRAAAYAERADEPNPAVTVAREAWHEALLERGMLPYLEAFLRDKASFGPPPAAAQDTLGDGQGAAGNTTGGTGGSGDRREPDPSFSSPGRSGPDFSSPDFSSPDFGSPDFSDPDFSGPDFSSPDFSSPDFRGPTSRPAQEQ